MRRFLGLVVAVLVANAGFGLAGTVAQTAATSQSSVGAPVPSLSLVQARNVGPDQVIRVVGYVVGNYLCPPCPAQAQCKPCSGPTSIFLAETASHPRVVLIDPASDVLAVGVTDPAAYMPGVQYRFEITTANRSDGDLDGTLIRSQLFTDVP